MLVLLFLCMTNRVNKVTIRINGSSLGLYSFPRGAGSTPARDKAFLVIYLGLACYCYIQFLFSSPAKLGFTYFSLPGSLEAARLRRGSKGRRKTFHTTALLSCLL